MPHSFITNLHPGESITIVLSTEANTSLDEEEAVTAQSNHDVKLFQNWQAQHAKTCAISCR